MNNIEQSLTSAIAKAVNDVYGMEPEAGLVMVEIPKDTANGDYSTNIAMRLPKLVHKAPQEIAKAIVEKLEQSLDNVETIEIAGPGFINFRMKKTAISSIINTVLEKGAKYGQNYSGKRESVLVEYVSANPTGNLHLGHARGAVWGDCMCRLMKASGYDVLREYYINDAGHQMWVFGQSVYARYCELFGKTDYPVPEDGYHSPDIIDIAQEIKDKVGDKWLNAPEEQAIPFFKMEGYHIQLAKIEQDLHEFGCDFDSWVSEQWIVDEGRVDEVLPVFEKKGLMYEEDGAVWLRTSQFGDDKDRVLKKKDGAGHCQPHVQIRARLHQADQPVGRRPPRLYPPHEGRHCRFGARPEKPGHCADSDGAPGGERPGSEDVQAHGQRRHHSRAA